MKSNVNQGICYPQPTTLAQRLPIANDFIHRFHFPIPMGVDPMSNAADHTYAAWPERIYIINRAGRIAYMGGLGPFDYHPSQAREWLARRFPQASAASVAAGSVAP